MEVLLIKSSEITAFTPMGGNVDIDKYTPCIYDVQMMVIEPLLTSELYEKIKTDFAADSLTGLYATLYNDYLKPILRHQTFAEYVEIGSYVVGNGGTYKNVPDNAEVVSKSEVQYLAQTQRSKAQFYIERAKTWLKKNNLPEYGNSCCDKSTIKVTSGWHL